MFSIGLKDLDRNLRATPLTMNQNEGLVPACPRGWQIKEIGLHG